MSKPFPDKNMNGEVCPASLPASLYTCEWVRQETPGLQHKLCRGQVRVVRRMVRPLDLWHTEDAPIKCFLLVAKTIMDSLIPENSADYMAIQRNGDIQVCLWQVIEMSEIYQRSASDHLPVQPI